MPYFEVTRYVLVNQVVTVEADSKKEAERKAIDPFAGKVQFEEKVDVNHVESVKGEEDFTNA